MHRAAYVTVLAAAYLATASSSAFVQPLQVGSPVLEGRILGAPQINIRNPGHLASIDWRAIEASSATLDGLDGRAPFPCVRSVGCYPPEGALPSLCD